jgi:hypothetical protein
VRCDLNAEFAVASEWGFQTPIANIAGVTAILAVSQDPALQLAQKAWLQLDRQNPAPSIPANEEVGESRSHPQVSRTPRGHTPSAP